MPTPIVPTEGQISLTNIVSAFPGAEDTTRFGGFQGVHANIAETGEVRLTDFAGLTAPTPAFVPFDLVNDDLEASFADGVLAVGLGAAGTTPIVTVDLRERLVDAAFQGALTFSSEAPLPDGVTLSTDGIITMDRTLFTLASAVTIAATNVHGNSFTQQVSLLPASPDAPRLLLIAGQNQTLDEFDGVTMWEPVGSQNSAVFEPGGATAPTYNATGGGVSGLLPYVSFDGVSDYLRESQGAFQMQASTGGGYTIIAYMRGPPDTLASKNFYFSGWSSGPGSGLYVELSTPQNGTDLEHKTFTALDFGQPLFGTNYVVPGEWNIYALRVTNNTSGELFKNSRATVATTTTNVGSMQNMVWEMLTLGSDRFGNNHSEIHLNFFGLYDYPLSDTQLDDVFAAATDGLAPPDTTARTAPEAPTGYAMLLVAGSDQVVDGSGDVTEWSATGASTAGAVFQPADTGTAPAYVATGGGTAGTLPYIKFNGVSDILRNTSGTLAINSADGGGMTIVMLMRYPNAFVPDSSPRVIAAFEGSEDIQMIRAPGYYQDGSLMFFTKGPQSGGILELVDAHTTGAWFVAAMRFTSGTSFELFTDTITNVSTKAVTATAANVDWLNNFNIGAFSATQEWADCEINFMGIWPRALSDVELETLLSVDTLEAGIAFTPAAPEPTPTPYPPIAMTTDSETVTGSEYGNGTYVASASTVSSYGGAEAYRAFNKNVAYGQWWESLAGTYSPGSGGPQNNGVYAASETTTVDGVAVAGEWVQIQMPASIVLKSYGVAPREDSGYMLSQRNIGTWVLAGSTDGVTWAQLSAVTGHQWTANGTFTVDLSSNVTAFSVFRFICIDIGNEFSGDHNAATVNEVFLDGIPA